MMNLAEYRNKSPGSPTSCPGPRWSAPASCSTRTAASSAPPGFAVLISISAVPAELVAVAGRFNNAFRRLGSGWAIFVEAQRHPPRPYPNSTFPDPRRPGRCRAEGRFRGSGAHFESSYFLTFTYLPPAEDAARAEAGFTRPRADRRRPVRR